MKLIRYGNPGEEKPGIMLNDTYYDTAALGEDYTNDFLSNGGLERLATFIRKEQLQPIPADARLGVPLANPGKIVCVGLNYRDHIAETGFIPESEPILFLKAMSALNGPFDGVTIPKNSQETDWETELGVVIGKKGTNINPEESMDYIAGYILHNDISERAYMKKRGGTWDKGKGCNTFAPLGPWFVTKDEIPDPGQLSIWLKLNGELMQNGHTSDLICNVPNLIAYISEFFGLFPGDIISTGSPAGSGTGRMPQRFLQPGDIIEYGIDGLGTARQQMREYQS
ncbi:2-keto-4-pentenoate hydratase/2-oxohepta-3-ene-1,7-dioic acid hydratase in catechol pathway [Chitinophaga dinghuensis]|uniref:2-keto-4-pentenoate hydratase/2-oxohepta-3-ene-1,7-dioic acid hydratase in catechol pathway n=1 Tax=Chitinophaga dinghuensis TaxID=1539050 RepID=A0A327WBY0_9BACT|nr:fumarylacetoacetate hydrolase family protein [Chitinophaga dinghuensis]RAJ88267.1 2-keto-4-pentenoate hydratase/2-oxohepta-3-ene-1,7-dioic acid hydratase in catechol pathway [Chitinophaga dinghuensis]